MNTDKSDTPRTDAGEFPVMITFSNENPLVVRSTLARQLERELNEVKAQLAKVTEITFGEALMLRDAIAKVEGKSEV